jgi:hypothetical protein
MQQHLSSRVPTPAATSCAAESTFQVLFDRDRCINPIISVQSDAGADSILQKRRATRALSAALEATSSPTCCNASLKAAHPCRPACTTRQLFLGRKRIQVQPREHFFRSQKAGVPCTLLSRSSNDLLYCAALQPTAARRKLLRKGGHAAFFRAMYARKATSWPKGRLRYVYSHYAALCTRIRSPSFPPELTRGCTGCYEPAARFP